MTKENNELVILIENEELKSALKLLNSILSKRK